MALDLLGSPFRVNPYIARSFQVLVECIIFLKEGNDSQRAVWRNPFEAETVSGTSVISIFRLACDALDLRFPCPSISNSESVIRSACLILETENYAFSFSPLPEPFATIKRLIS